MPFAFITVTFESTNISASDLGLAPSVSSLALDIWSVDLGLGDMDGLDSDQKYIVFTLVNHTAILLLQLTHILLL